MLNWAKRYIALRDIKSFKCLWIQKHPSRCVILKRCSENMQKTYRKTSMLKCNFNKIACNFTEIELRHACSPLNLQHIFRTLFPKNTWRAASVSWIINFEKSEKVRLDHDEDVNITYFFAAEQVFTIKITQTLIKSRLFQFFTFRYTWTKTKLAPRLRKTRFWKITIFWVFAQIYLKRAPSRLFFSIFCEYSSNSCFTDTLEATTYVCFY